MANIPKPVNPGRTKGAMTCLIPINYQVIADWAVLSVSTVRQYASRGQFDSRNLDSVLQWCNERRKSKGIPPVGVFQMPVETPENTVSAPIPTPPPRSGYNPLKGNYDG